MNVEYVAFEDRAARTRYVAERFRPYLATRVLDVGCDRAPLRGLVPGAGYVGLDLTPEADVRHDLDAAAPLPFLAAEFECVVCVEVLEHLDRLHDVFEELVRVARRYLLVSLPNCWALARQPIGRGHGTFSHYGLPVDPPLDRHRWFFSLADAERFFRERGARHGLRIVELHATEKPRPALVRAARRLRYPAQSRYLNRYAQTLWVVFEKPPAA